MLNIIMFRTSVRLYVVHICNSSRCTSEAAASEGVSQALRDALRWYQLEGLPQWNACQEAEDLEGLRALKEEAEMVGPGAGGGDVVGWRIKDKATDVFKPSPRPGSRAQIVLEVEEAVAAEEGLESDEQRVWLRASAYDCYDMMVMCVHQI